MSDTLPTPIYAQSDCIDIYPLNIDRQQATYYAKIADPGASPALTDGDILNDQDKYAKKLAEYKLVMQSNYLSAYQYQLLEFYQSSEYFTEINYQDNLDSNGLQNKHFYNGRILTEHNLSQLARSIIDRTGYVITRNLETSGTQIAAIEFVIAGRYIHLRDSQLLRKPNLYVYADINNFTNYYYPEYSYLKNAYDNSHQIAVDDSITDVWEFKGLEFYTTELETPGTRIGLQLLSNSKIPTDSMRKFDTYSITNINGGTV